MLSFEPRDFPDYHTYETNRNRLERAQRLATHIYDALIASTGRVEEESALDCEIRHMLYGIVQIGYEAALGMPHKASDYDITPETLDTYPEACVFCTHRYTMDGCEMNCSLEDRGEQCKLEVKEFLD